MPDDQAAVVTAPRATSLQGFTEAGLAAFNAEFHKLVDEQKLANVVTLVARHGEIVNLDAYGALDVSDPARGPVQADSIFRIASMTKPITGAAMMMLWEEGKWALDDPVAKHIPAFADLKVRRKDGGPVPQAKPDDHGAADEPHRRLWPRRRIRRQGRQPAGRRPAGHDRCAGGPAAVVPAGHRLALWPQRRHPGLPGRADERPWGWTNSSSSASSRRSA